MNRVLLPFLVILLPLLVAAGTTPTRYAIATTATPVLNTPAFAKVFGGQFKLDPCKGVRPIEFIALTGTLFRIEGEQKEGGVTIYRVTSNDYPYRSATGYFVDGRFLKPAAPPVKERPRLLPGMVQLQQRLLAALGKPYVWGGNQKGGVPLLRELYPRADPLAGVDCSGLLYEATDGFTPRNSAALTLFGATVPVAGLSPERLVQKLKPLDLIVWKGHVMILLDRDTIIESVMGCQGGGGVRLTPVREGVRRLMKSRVPLDDFSQSKAAVKGFVVRRWFPS